MARSGQTLQRESLPARGRKVFTLSEARRALALVKRIVADIRSSNTHRLALHAQMSADMASAFPERLESLQTAFNRQSERLDSLADELAKIGVEIKDRARGLVDFPTLHEGREVFLCWESQDDTIAFWHEPDAGYTGRRPVSELHDAT